MRSLTIKGRDIPVRSRLRKERKDLEKKGHRFPVPEYEKAFKTMDAVFEVIFDQETMAFIDEELDDAQTNRLWTAFVAETFGLPDEVKN